MADSLSVLNTSNISQLLNNVGYGLITQASITANVNLVSAVTEYPIMSTQNVVWRNNRAYSVTMWGLANASTTSSYFLLRLRKGTGVSGALWKDQIRFTALNTSAGTNVMFNFTTVLVNTTGADITSTMTLTASVNTGTGVYAASTNNESYLTVTDCGSAMNWPGQPIS